ncbi:MAG: hypothetical protein QXE01_11750, partial [Sulfolobales archaeon]
NHWGGEYARIFDMMVAEAREMARKSFEPIAVFQRGGAKMTIELLRKEDGYGLTIPHYYALLAAGEALKTMPPLSMTGFADSVARIFPYITPDKDYGYTLAKLRNESITKEYYEELRRRACMDATSGQQITAGYPYDPLWILVKYGKQYANKTVSEKEIDDLCQRFSELLTMRRVDPSLALLVKGAEAFNGKHTAIIIWMEPDGKNDFNIFVATIDGDPRPAAELAYELIKNISIAFNAIVSLLYDPVNLLGEPLGDYELMRYAVENGKPCDYYLWQRSTSMLASMCGQIVDNVLGRLVIMYGSIPFLAEFTKVVLKPVAKPAAIEWIDKAEPILIECLYNYRCFEFSGYNVINIYRGWPIIIDIGINKRDLYRGLYENIDHSKVFVLVSGFDEDKYKQNEGYQKFLEIMSKLPSTRRMPIGYFIDDSSGIRYSVSDAEMPREIPASYEYQVVYLVPGVSKAVG